MRKSGRQRVPTQKFAESAEFPLEALVTDESDEGEKLPNENIGGDVSDFSIEVASDEPDVETDISASEAESEYGLSDSPGSEELQEPLSQGYSEAYAMPHVHKLTKNRPLAKAVRDRSSQSRRDRSSVQNNITYLAGVDQAHREALEKTTQQWELDPCLPSRGRMKLPFLHDLKQIGREAREGWDWYFDGGGKERFSEQQSELVVTPEEGRKYIFGTSQNLLLGPCGRQKLVNLPHLHSLPLDATEIGVHNGASQQVPEPDPHPPSTEKRYGCFLNVGIRLDCLDWAPNHDGDSQYLALSSSQGPRLLTKALPTTAPAFDPAPPSPSSIQIWSFCINRPTEPTSSPQRQLEPTLAQVLCSEWGPISQIKWCPMARTPREPSDPDQQFIGLLAAISADGYARILSINLAHDIPITYLKITAPFLTTRPATSITTSLAWLSPNHIATGHSDGSISVHDLTMTSRATLLHNAFTIQTIQPPHIPSPILALAQAYPTHPNLITASAVSGHTRLLDLRSPNTDYSLMPRTRWPPSNLIFSPHLASFIHNDDGDSTLRATSPGLWGNKRGSITFRRTGPRGSSRTNSAGMKKGGGEKMEIGIGPMGRGCLDSGKVHPCIAWGGPDGKVMVCNPLMSILGSSRKMQADWNVCVCRLEWVRRKESPEMRASAGSVDEQRDGNNVVDDNVGQGGGTRIGSGRSGISRITQSYKAEKAEHGPTRGDKARQLTTFEEENAVTAVCWNPNLSCGGWLAVGWANGLVRIEDVAI